MNKFLKVFIILSVSFVFTFFASGSFAQTINTGDASATTIIDNQVNTNVVDCDCTPTPTPSVITPTPTTVQETPTPTPTPGGGGNGGPTGDGGGQGAGAPSAPTQAVLGLAAASSNNPLVEFMQLVVALVLSVAGLRLFTKHA